MYRTKPIEKGEDESNAEEGKDEDRKGKRNEESGGGGERDREGESGKNEREDRGWGIKIRSIRKIGISKPKIGRGKTKV